MKISIDLKINICKVIAYYGLHTSSETKMEALHDVRRRIVVLGAGVAGIRFILDFEPKVKSLGNVKITLVDQYDYHQYIHKLHEVAGGRSEPKEIVVPIKWLIRDKNVEFKQAKVESIDIEGKMVNTDKGNIQYDILVIALGSQTCYYGIKGLEKNSLGLKSVVESYQIRKKVDEIFESARERDKPLTFIIGGGGYTGVELAGEFAEYFPPLAEKYGVDPEDIKLIIVEAMDTILPEWGPKVTEGAMEILRSKGVNVMLNQPIVKADGRGITVKNGEKISADLLVWTGGVEGVTVCPAFDYGNSKRVLISNICEATNAPDVYAIGDCAFVCDVSTNEPFAPSAHIAMEQASFLAKNLYAQIVGKPQKDYVPKHLGEIVSIGREHAVGSLWGIQLKGWIARIAKKMIHIGYVYSIGGVRLMFNWKHMGESTEWGESDHLNT